MPEEKFTVKEIKTYINKCIALGQTVGQASYFCTPMNIQKACKDKENVNTSK